MVEAVRRHADALIPYIGGKRKLAPFLLSLVESELPRIEWRHSVFLDPFSGGGSVALLAKSFGFSVIASDIAERASIVVRALIANSSFRLTPLDVAGLFENVDVPVVGPAARLVGSVFTAEQAAFIDRGLAHAQRQAEPRRSMLLVVIIKAVLRLFPMSAPSATDAVAAVGGDYDRVSPRRIGHYLRARALLTPAHLWRIAQDVNAGVFAGHGTALQIDALAAIVSNTPDVLYIDPPYAGTTSYHTHYAVIDRLLGGPPLETTPPSIDDLLDAAHDVPLVMISYGGPTANIASLSELVARHRTVCRAVAIPYPHLASVAKELNRESNRELVVIARR